jgi:hypothetical protein
MTVKLQVNETLQYRIFSSPLHVVFMEMFVFSLRLEIGTGLQYGIEKYPRMRLKRDVIFGFADLWGESL